MGRATSPKASIVCARAANRCTGSIRAGVIEARAARATSRFGCRGIDVAKRAAARQGSCIEQNARWMPMIRTGAQYREGLRDGREVWIDGERVGDITSHPATRPIVDIRARMFDMQHEADHVATMTYVDDNKRHSIF